MQNGFQQHIEAELRGLQGRIEHLKVRLQGGDSPTVRQIEAELRRLEQRRRELTLQAGRRSGGGRVGARAMLDKAVIDLKEAARLAYLKIRK